MFIPADIIDARIQSGELSLTVTPAALIRALVLIGKLPASEIRTDFLAAYGEREAGETAPEFLQLAPKGVVAAHPLGPADITALAPIERVYFLKGAQLMLRRRLGESEPTLCICNMPPAVLLPIAAFASLLRDDLAVARKAWKDFAQIRRWCAERLPGYDGNVGLAGLGFEEFILSLSGPAVEDDEDLETMARRAAKAMFKAYRIDARGERGL